MTVSRNIFGGQPLPSQSTPPSVTWRGVSGASYEFQLHPIGTHYKPRPGVYIFCAENSPGRWRPLYIGEGVDFDDRVGSNRAAHHKWESIVRVRATHICTLVVSGGKAARVAVETDLRHFYNPPLNDQ